MQSASRRFTLLKATTLVIVVACSRGGAVTTTGQEEPATSTEVPALSDVGEQSLSEGEFQLTAAGFFGDPGFLEALTVTQDLPQSLGKTAGMRLVLRLRDAGRAGESCSRDHPLSGCATVDWTDSPSRTKVPRGDVFENSLTLQLVSGLRTFFLSYAGTLENDPDPFKPGSPYTAVGGSARQWETVLPSDIVPGGVLELRLVMTKLGPPGVTIAYEVVLEDIGG